MKILEGRTIGDVYTMDRRPSLLVGPDERFTAVVRRFAERPEMRGIFVVGEKDRLIGVITRRDLLDWARVQLGEATYSTEEAWLAEDVRLTALMRAITAGEVMRPGSEAAAVRPSDTLAEALRRMIAHDLICLPVVDEQGRVLGDLKLTEVLACALEANSQADEASDIDLMPRC